MSQVVTAEVGRTGVRLARLGFGGAAIANLFTPVAVDAAAGAVAAAYDSGIRHFDTAPYYGYGLSETRLGAALGRLPQDGLTVSTKVGYALGDDLARESGGLFRGDVPDLGVGFDYSRDGIMRSLEGSLARLRRPAVEIVLLHDLDPTVHRDPESFEGHRRTALAEGWPTLRELRASGVVRAIGFGLNHADAARELLEDTDPDIILLAGRYTLLEHSESLPLLDACAERGVAVMIGGPFNSGILASGSPTAAMYDYAAPGPAILERVRHLDEVCAGHGVEIAAAALQFVFGQPAVVTVLPGMRSADEAIRNCRLLATSIPAALWQDLRDRGLISGDAPTP